MFDDDFVPRFLKATSALPTDWDLLTLNWYCTTESPWEPWCKKNSIANEEVGFAGSGLAKVAAFMSGGAIAVSKRGAEKIINSFPCQEQKDTVHLGKTSVCSIFVLRL
eukprot:SAG31_NODE_4986_length_2819_cov_2.012868_2_plen_108_part_00